MADEDLVAYLADNVPRFGLDDVQEKLLSEGVPEAKIRKAADVLLMRRLAAAAVVMAQDEFGAPLDYSPESLLVVDEILRVRAETLKGQDDEEAWGVAKVWGAYAGECMVRGLAGRWVFETVAEAGCHAQVEVNGLRCNVLDSVFRRLRGEYKSVAGLYEFGRQFPELERQRRARAAQGESS